METATNQSENEFIHNQLLEQHEMLTAEKEMDDGLREQEQAPEEGNDTKLTAEEAELTKEEVGDRKEENGKEEEEEKKEEENKKEKEEHQEKGKVTEQQQEERPVRKTDEAKEMEKQAQLVEERKEEEEEKIKDEEGEEKDNEEEEPIENSKNNGREVKEKEEEEEEAEEDGLSTSPPIDEEDSRVLLNCAHKQRIPNESGGRSVSVTALLFLRRTQELVLGVKGASITGTATYKIHQLLPGAKLKQQKKRNQRLTPGYVAEEPSGRFEAAAVTSLQAGRSSSYSSFEHSNLGVCELGAAGEMLCAGWGRRIHGVFRLQILSVSQPVLCQIASPQGERVGQFRQPAGCAAEPDDSFAYVADNGNNRLQMFALPTLTPMAEFGKGLVLRPSHMVIHEQQRQLIVCHECGIAVFDLPDRGQSPGGLQKVPSFACHLTSGGQRRWGGICVHWSLVCVSDQVAASVRLFRPTPGCQYRELLRFPLRPLGLCLPRWLTSDKWRDLLYLCAVDCNSAEPCLCTLQLSRQPAVYG